MTEREGRATGEEGAASRLTTAIVAEGGGQRGIYTAGVLDAFLRERYNPFGLGIGVSAGAQNLLAYFLEQPGFARRAIAELTAAPDFFVPYRWFGARGMIDLDGYFERAVAHPDFLLPCRKIGSLRGRRRLVFVATDRDTLEPVYLEPNADDVVESMKASSAVPFLYRSGVRVGRRHLVDGGVADPLPIRHAHRLGARRVLLVRTVADGERDCTSWRQRLTRAARAAALPASMRRMLAAHERACEAALLFRRAPPDGVEVLEIRPAAPLRSGLFGSRSDALLSDYRTGLADGERALRELGHWSESELTGPSPSMSCSFSPRSSGTEAFAGRRLRRDGVVSIGSSTGGHHGYFREEGDTDPSRPGGRDG